MLKAWFNQGLTAVVACLAWSTVSSGLILLNKQLLSKGFAYPMALSGLGMAFSSLASLLCCKVFKLVEAKKQVGPRFYVTRIMPVGLLMATSLYFGNVVYLYLTVAFIQILKAFCPVITLVALFMAGMETPDRRLILSVLLIATGTALASAGEINLNWTGIASMFLSEGCEAARLVMTQTILVGLQFHPIEGLMYLAPACALWLGIGSALVELPRMRAEGALEVVLQRPLAFALAAAMGFMVNSLAYVVIQTASSLTLKVLATVKNAAVVWIGITVLGETVTPVQGLGYAISILAFFWYNKIKMQQQLRKNLLAFTKPLGGSRTSSAQNLAASG